MNSKNTKAPESFTFESTIDDLERLILKLESQKSSLEDSLAAFEEGIGLTRRAQLSLSAAEQKVRLLAQSNGGPVEEIFVSDEENG